VEIKTLEEFAVRPLLGTVRPLASPMEMSTNSLLATSIFKVKVSDHDAETQDAFAKAVTVGDMQAISRNSRAFVEITNVVQTFTTTLIMESDPPKFGRVITT